MDTSDYHVPVLLQQSIEGLITDPNGIYIDGTMGGGGHTRTLLSKLDEQARVFAIDQDEEAIMLARNSWADDDRLTIIHGNFGYINTLLSPELHGHINGILLDLGVSSHQIDEPERGFSYQHDGPLDMRMGSMTGLSASEVINSYDKKDLARIFFEYGEERHSRKIADAILNARPITTTGELKEAVKSVVFGKHVNKSLARIFQAVRIEVNRELEMLKETLSSSLDLLTIEGRLSVISYHSLEDRLVKNFMKAGNFEGKIEKNLFGVPLSPIEPVTRKPVMADEQEIEDNPRARSARLRIGKKIEPEAE